MKKIILVIVCTYMALGGGSKLLADDPSDSFDIMYVYTTKARINAGGTDAIRNKIITAFNRINESFINSDMDLRANLVHMEEISYNFTTSSRALTQLLSKYDGVIDDVHRLRDRYSADFVQLVVGNGSEHGLANTMFNVTPSAESNAFALIRYDHMNGASVHELGHTMGMQHDYHANGNAPNSGGSHPYAWGYKNSTIKTIMGATPHRTQILYWSSPNLYYDGQVLGTNGIDARRAILENAPIFCNFRKRPVTTSPILTTNPVSETLSDSITIEVNGEAGYEIYVNGVYKGVLNYNGKKTLTLDLASVHNNFTIILKHEPSGTVSDSLEFTIIKKIDTDNDGIYDHIEENLGLNPNSVDSDGDGYTDLEEVGDVNNPKDTDNDGIIDALDEDSDNDGVSDKDERLANIVVVTVIVPYILNGN